MGIHIIQLKSINALGFLYLDGGYDKKARKYVLDIEYFDTIGQKMGNLTRHFFVAHRIVEEVKAVRIGFQADVFPLPILFQLLLNVNQDIAEWLQVERSKFR